MPDNPEMQSYKRHRFPPDIISYAVWLSHRFNLRHRDIEDLLAQRGLTVSYESIRLWCIKFGPHGRPREVSKLAFLADRRRDEAEAIHGRVDHWDFERS